MHLTIDPVTKTPASECAVTRLDVITSPTRAQFSRYLVGAGAPVVVRGALDGWPARTKWSFSYFAELFGETKVELNSNIIDGQNNTRVVTPFSELTRALQAGDCTGLADAVAEGPWPPRWGLYFTASIAEMAPFRSRLFADFDPQFPFVDDLVQAMGDPYRYLPFTLPFGNLYLGEAGTRAKLHPDYWGSHTYIAQLVGQKHAIFYAPDDADKLSNGPLSYVDPREPDVHAFPRFASATRYEASLEAGDLLFIPSGWLHDVVALTASISLSWNFATRENVAQYLRGAVSHPDALAYAHTLGVLPAAAG